MRIVVSDIETDAIENPDTLWLHGGIDLKTRERFQFEPFRGEKEKQEAIKWSESVDLWIGHNFIPYDAKQLNRLLRPRLIDPTKVIDTMVVSRLLHYDRPTPPGCKSGHSLKAHGIRLGIHKGDFSKFDQWSEEMVEYWKGDLDVTEVLFEDFKPYIYDPDWKSSMRVEHDIQIEMERQKYYGFDFDSEKAKPMLESITKKMKVLEAGFQEDFPPTLEHVKTLNYVVKKDGQEGVHVQNAKQNHAMTKVEDGQLLCYDYVPFKPGSPQRRVDVLWEAGWKPFEKTKTHQKFGRLKVGSPYGKAGTPMTQEFYDNKKAHLDRYGWTCGEDNLATLPAKAPAGARNLAQWLTLEGRRSSLVEWLGQVKSDGRIHGSVMGIGAWTGRCAHKGPNTANIASPFHGEPKNAVQEVKKEYDYDMRALWGVGEGEWQVGCDAAGIQLRILACTLNKHFKSEAYIKAIVEGRKEDETDIHNVNRKALGLAHLTRDDAKTFVYAWLLNAGIPKIASILRTTPQIATKSRENFESSIDGLKDMKNKLLPYIADQGWFTGYDGRKVPVPNLHKCLAGILQNGEAVLMKHWIVEWLAQARKEKIDFNLMGFVHDETETKVRGSRDSAERLAQIQEETIITVGQRLGITCPLEAESKIGKNWAECH